MNAVEIEQAISDLAALPFDRAEFAFAFLEAFGNKATTLKKLRSGASNASDVPGGVLQRSNIHIATCDSGVVDDTLKALRDSPKTAAAKAKFILATDGDQFQAEDLASGETVSCTYAEFPDHFGVFLPLAGITTVKQIRESTFDIRATSRLNKLYVELLKDNPDWASAERRPDMNHFMARLIFCFFAEDTDIFHGEGLFSKTVEQISARDSSDTAHVISEIFRAMDTKLDDRAGANIPRYACGFPYVNGQLFSGSTETPRFTRIARSYLVHIGNLNWKKINPDIFGSMIQAVADDEERGALGMHYTSVPNILKVLNPLFLNDLRASLDEAGDNGRKLLNLRQRMAKIRVFDPACGSGNFLVIAYKQIREIEAEINRRRGEPDRRSDIPLTNYRGIELRDFPAEIARLALIIAEFQCDVTYRGQQEALLEFLPLDSQNWITCGNALQYDWLYLCPPTGTGVKLQADDLFKTDLQQAEIDFENEGGETYICGNPPYLGSTLQSDEQKADLQAIFSHRTNNWKSLDYVAGWFMKAADYGMRTNAAAAFVSTNSICQGQQVPILWPLIFATGHEIAFAHTSFKWANLASFNAGVTVAIISIAIDVPSSRQLFSESDIGEPIMQQVSHINAYLVAGPNIIVHSRNSPPDGRQEIDAGGKPVEGGHLLLTVHERDQLLREVPMASRFLKRVFGANEHNKGIVRYALWIGDDGAPIAEQDERLKRRLDGVREMRLASPKPATRASAGRPHRFQEVKQTGVERVTLVPVLTSEKRQFIPVGLEPSGTIITNLSFAQLDGPISDIAILNSRLHFIWIATVCGKFKTDYRYSNTMGWNTFPIPKLTEQNKADLMRCAEDILLAREAHFPATIADLYEVKDGENKMPENLRHAHERNDEVLERIYIGRRFKNDTERLEKLFELYARMTGARAAA
ncbi:class I SAM-dependent DNA methyltransferase [Rhizorhapis suberifaciens]|uniref:site-specific DNA-methyltransferase (adenine-specific) n=1 Tax=Rhizorhapis suberifaciens TaxID=13656 RepID=A0A840HWA2_9SPHN|nr:class I SAM-dependent DNA methyltransferase [Rhizorhapis suberifaciens]MBB4642592.1 hypothetical protein [Rhizorhapis suberifaciens]